jgi:hypothetical protein
MKPLGALRFDIRREVRNSGEPRVHRTLIRLAPAQKPHLGWGLLLVRGRFERRDL